MKPIYELPDITEERGNIFNIISEVSKILNFHGLRKEAREMQTRIVANNEANSYEEALQIIGEYVDIV